MHTLHCVLVNILFLFAPGETVQSAVPADFLSQLDPAHPRLFLTDSRLADLKGQAQDDSVLAQCIEQVLRRADSYVGRDPVVYKVVGPRLLSVSRDCLNRVVACSLAWRWTGQSKYADTAIANMKAACNFPNWNPSHYLDTAEMSNALGIGYDWLYHYMDEDTRGTIRAGLIKHGLEEGVRAYTSDRQHWFVSSHHNWNQVCNGGMIVGALAIAESDPKYAEVIVPAAVKSLPLALRSYAPDGAWMEGPGYWHYATQYTAYGIDALRTALGTDFGLLSIDGLDEAGLAPIFTAGPKGLYLNYADSGSKAARRPMPCMFWLAHCYDNPVIAASEHRQLKQRSASPEHIIWYVPPTEEGIDDLPLDKYFRGDVELALFRSAWNDPKALFLGIKAGYNQVNHGHLDLGNFELDALGVRWAVDLGSDDYNMPGYWSSGRGGKRWSYYRLNSLSHNVPLLNNQSQDPLAKARIVKFYSNGSPPLAIVDLAKAWPDLAESALRGVSMIGDRKAVLVQDEVRLKRDCEVAWGMTTEADISVGGDGTATLTQGGEKLIARVLAPVGAAFTIESAEQQLPQKSNKGVRRLMLRLPDCQGEVRVAVLLSPVWPDGAVQDVRIRPLSKW